MWSAGGLNPHPHPPGEAKCPNQAGTCPTLTPVSSLTCLEGRRGAGGSWNPTEALPRLPGTSLEAHQVPGAADSSSPGREGGWRRRGGTRSQTWMALSKICSLGTSSRSSPEGGTLVTAGEGLPSALCPLPSPVCRAEGHPECLGTRGPLVRGQEEKHDTPLTAAAFTGAKGGNSPTVHGRMNG